jgi:3-keto-disaccharide hydrolase
MTGAGGGSRVKYWVAGACLAAMVAGAAIYERREGPVPSGLPTARPEGVGWVDLLDANHAAGWRNITDDRAIFEISDGVLHVLGTSPVSLRYAGYTAEQFGDFDLHLEFKVSHRANSGVFLRTQADDPVQRGFEVQVLDDFGKPPTKNRSGAIYDVITPMFNMSRPAGRWNSYDITVAGQEVTVHMNGWLVIRADFSKMVEPLGKFPVPYAELEPEGLLALQDHGGEVWYRNILIRKR